MYIITPFSINVKILILISTLCASFRNQLGTRVGKIQVMKVIVLLIIVMIMYGCGWKTKVSCNVDDINTVIDDCKKQPQFGISKEF